MLIRRTYLYGVLLLLLAGSSSVQAQFTFKHSNYQKGSGFVTDVTGHRPDANKGAGTANGLYWNVIKVSFLIIILL
jgi:hypothetical protein